MCYCTLIHTTGNFILLFCYWNIKIEARHLKYIRIDRIGSINSDIKLIMTGFFLLKQLMSSTILQNRSSSILDNSCLYCYSTSFDHGYSEERKNIIMIIDNTDVWVHTGLALSFATLTYRFHITSLGMRMENYWVSPWKKLPSVRERTMNSVCWILLLLSRI